MDRALSDLAYLYEWVGAETGEAVVLNNSENRFLTVAAQNRH